MESETILNFRTRASNLTPDSPYSAFKSLLEQLIKICRSESLETSSCVESSTDRDARRIKINEAKDNLLNLLVDPQALWIEYREKLKQEQEFNK